MNEAVTMALEHNLGLRADRMDVEVADQGIVSAKSAYLPQLTAAFRNNSSRSVPNDFTEGITDITSQGRSIAATVSQLTPWFGGSYQASWQGNRNETLGRQGISFNPTLGSNISLSYSQPLWRNFKIDSPRVGVETSQRQRSIADLTLQRQVVFYEVTVKNAYLNLIAAVERRKVTQQNMDIVEESLRNARARVEVGQSPKIDVVQAEAEVASNRESLIAADAAIGTAEDNLRQLILDPSRPDYWTVRLEATETIQLTPFKVDLDGAIKNALASRVDLETIRQNVAINDLQLDLNKNLTRPDVRLDLNYQATGTAGSQFEFGEGFPPPVVSRTDRSFGSALGDAFTGAYPSWSAAINVNYPIGKTAQRAALARTEIARRQLDLDIKGLELQIVRDVREAARQVQNSFERVQAARTAREASEVQLEAENRRFQVGMSTTLEQQVRQRSLAQARLQELQAMIDYNRAIINFERAQKIQ
jgi:outer membrane protein TolC